MYTIVSISGGGVRGLIPARELSVIPVKEQENIDCFAGTSTGGILALGAASGFSFKEIEDFYKKWIPTIFKPRSWLDKLWKFDELRRANYDNEGLIRACQEVFGGLTIADLKHDIVVPSVNLDSVDPDSGVRSAQPVWYTKTMPNADKTFVWEVAVKTASAPCYFPSYNGFIDGGTCMNNPAAKAVQMALNYGIPLEYISLLAVTTGTAPSYKDTKRNDWGIVKWGPDIVSLILSLSEQVSLDLLHINGLGYYGVADYTLTKNVKLDDVSWAKKFNYSSYLKDIKAIRAIDNFRKTLYEA